MSNRNHVEHVAGPWAWIETDEANAFTILFDGEIKWLASIRLNGELLPEKQKATLQAMIAAPALYEAIDLLLSCRSREQIREAWAKARAAKALADARPWFPPLSVDEADRLIMEKEIEK